MFSCDNAKWLSLSAPFRWRSVSAAYMVPFYIDHGVSTGRVFLLLGIFTAVAVLWEIPSGIFADRIGQARSIKLGLFLAGITIIVCGLSKEFWQFALCEVGLALAVGMVLGSDTSLLFDSLAVQRRGAEFIKFSQRINALGSGSFVVGVPIALIAIYFWGISSVLIVDGCSMMIAAFLVLRLVDIPKAERCHVQSWRSTGQALAGLLGNSRIRWLIILQASLASGVYASFWLSALYYAQLGIPVIWFGALLAARNLLKAWLGHRFRHEKYLFRAFFGYASLVAIVFFAMATGVPWIAWVVLGHDLIQALAFAPLTKRLNEDMDEAHRATLNSAVLLVQRIAGLVVGAVVSWTVSSHGLAAGLVAAGLCTGAAAHYALWRVQRMGEFAKR